RPAGRSHPGRRAHPVGGRVVHGDGRGARLRRPPQRAGQPRSHQARRRPHLRPGRRRRAGRRDPPPDTRRLARRPLPPACEHLAVLAVALALASSVVWGTADFLGGIYTRRLGLAPVLVVSQLAGLILLGVATGLTGELDVHAFAVGLAAGVFGAVGIAAFYRALATGTISIVSPVSACGALVPVGLALIQGERPGALALAGSAVGLAGA